MDVKAGAFVQFHWAAFRFAHFRGMSDVGAARALRAWCDRNGIEPHLREGKTELGGKVFAVIHLQLRAKINHEADR